MIKLTQTIILPAGMTIPTLLDVADNTPIEVVWVTLPSHLSTPTCKKPGISVHGTPIQLDKFFADLKKAL